MRAAHGSRRRWSWAGALLLLAAALSWPGVAAAQEKVVKIGLALDFTRVYTFAIEEMHQGHRDYLELVNLRGGVNGWRFEPLVTDTGNEPQRGIEAYERFKREGALIFDFVSTPVSTAVLPRILEDQLVMVTPLTGRSDATDGTTFPWVFPMMATYWSKAAVIVQYMLDEAGGDLSGQRVALVHIDSPFGREPIPVLQTLSQRLGYTFQTFPYPSPGTEQSAVWTQVRRFQPDWILIWGAGPGQAVSLREAIRNGISMDKIISVTWLAEKDMEAVGAAAARGVRRFEPVVPGREPQVIQDILNEVYGAGRGHGDPSNVGATYYNIGVAMMATVVEVVRKATADLDGPLTAAHIKAALETLTDFDAHGLMSPITITPADHEGGGKGRIAQWDGQRWVPVTDWMSAFRDVVWELVYAGAEEFRRTGQ
ncbi:MAG: ABC transporter substrate-binding protein [Limnochordales bacterium]|nr:ABC transporter substrate-binding protein [Limnochordales bacterium]